MHSPLPLSRHPHQNRTTRKGTPNPTPFPTKQTEKMIDQTIRDQLKDQTQYGDYERAAQIYQALVKKAITARYLHKFLFGHNNPTGQRPGTHHPKDMFAAVAQAVRERQTREQEANREARKILFDQILRDTKPQPVPQ